MSSNISSTVDKENVTVRARHANFRKILKRVFGSGVSFDFAATVVCSHSRGETAHKAGEYTSSSRYLPKDNKLPHRRSGDQHAATRGGARDREQTRTMNRRAFVVLKSPSRTLRSSATLIQHLPLRADCQVSTEG